MRAVWVTRHGGPEVLEVREAPDPSPRAGEVRIRVRAAGVNFADVMASTRPRPSRPPWSGTRSRGWSTRSARA
jgi:NADPH:quinone reductase-like Zn-dependent oxidoreductase